MGKEKVRFKIKGTTEEEKTLEFYLKEENGGDIVLRCKDFDGDYWNVIKIRKSGVLYRYGGLPDRIGLEVTRGGLIEVEVS